MPQFEDPAVYRGYCTHQVVHFLDKSGWDVFSWHGGDFYCWGALGQDFDGSGGWRDIYHHGLKSVYSVDGGEGFFLGFVRQVLFYVRGCDNGEGAAETIFYYAVGVVSVVS